MSLIQTDLIDSIGHHWYEKCCQECGHAIRTGRVIVALTITGHGYPNAFAHKSCLLDALSVPPDDPVSPGWAIQQVKEGELVQWVAESNR